MIDYILIVILIVLYIMFIIIKEIPGKQLKHNNYSTNNFYINDLNDSYQQSLKDLQKSDNEEFYKIPQQLRF